MKKLFKKLLPVTVVALALVSVLAVAAFATDYSWVGSVTPLDMSQEGVTKTYYEDIDGNEAWTQVASNNSAATRAFENTNFYWGFNHRAYYNASTQTLVIIPAATGSVMSGRAGVSASGGKIAMGSEKIPDDEVNTFRYTTLSGVNYYYVHAFDTWLVENGANIKHLEIRPYITSAGANSTKAVISQDFGAVVADDLVNVETIKLTDDFTIRASDGTAANANKTFISKPYLKTVQYGEFAQSGAFTTDCPENAVTLVEGATTGDNYGVSNAIFTGCSSIETVIIKTSSTGYIGLKKNAFKDCSSLKYVYIETAMSDSYLVGTDAFANCTDVNVYVDDTTKATALAALTNINLKTHAEYKVDLTLSSEGILVKIADNNTTGESVAIRFIFKWNEANTTKVGTPVKVGVVACSADYYSTVTGTLEEDKLASLLADTNTAKVKKNDVAVYNDGEVSLVGKFLSDGTDTENGVYSYAYTLYDIPAANYDSEIYAATYIQWSDGTYTVVSNSYTDYESKEKNTISLYDVTLGLFKQGLINSEKVADKYLWDVIKLGKTAADGQIEANNLEYYFFADNIDGNYVLVYKAITKFADDGVTLKGATIPHAKTAGTPWNDAQTKFLASNTIVVDYGVTGAASGSTRTFGPNWTNPVTKNETTKTLVYPVTFDLTAGTHAFHLMYALENVIWCHTDANGNYVAHMSDVTWTSDATQRNQLYDLRGFGSTLVQTTIDQFTAVVDTSNTYRRNIIIASNSSLSEACTAARNVWKAS